MTISEPGIECALQTEWLVTDGVGGFSSSTAAHCPTRRYHGLLVALPPGRAKRYVFLSRFDEVARGDGAELRMATARYIDGSYSPEGHERIEAFVAVPHPTTRYRAGALAITREIVMVRGAPTVLSRYTADGAAVELELRPLFAFREADALTVENDVAERTVQSSARGFEFEMYEGLPTCSVTVGGAEFEFHPEPTWYQGIEYEADIARGYDGCEDQFSPGRIVLRLEPDESVVVAATIGEPVSDPVSAWDAEVERRAEVRRAAVARWRESAIARVDAVAEDFLYRDHTGRLGICAGYPWFGEWGRDTFLSLPGLTLARDDVESCQAVIDGCLPFLRRGLLPNIYGTDQEDSHYGSVDAALWFARAVELFLDTGHVTKKRIKDVYLPALREIASSYRDGTDLGIGADDGGLISAGGPELNATWMDARTSAGPVTPRDGCAVEINALWYALLDLLTEIETSKVRAKQWRVARDLAGETFLERFWIEDGRYLADRWHDGEADETVRPNMVMAAALRRSPLTRSMRQDIVGKVHDELLTPCGLRTLSPADDDYLGVYGGGCDERDHAYHQGTVWPWLLGFYTEAALRSFGASEVPALRKAWSDVLTQLDHAGCEHISEVFSGDEPHTPGGTIAQAWNTAECLRSARMLDDPRLR